MEDLLDLDHVLRFDPLAQAELITGASYKDDDEMGKATLELGLSLAITHNSNKEALLKARGETTFSMSADDYMAAVVDLGFGDPLLEIDFDSRYVGSGEKLFVHWHPDGLLLAWDTFTWIPDKVPTRNSAKVWYNWEPSVEDYWPLISSGGLAGGVNGTGRVWVGDHDGREAIGYNLDKLRANGRFLDRWIERPFLWLLHYQDTKTEGYSYEAINAERIAQLPKHVREAIGPERPR